jgi:transcriptional regulator with XRE-family HTH domain
MTTFQKKSLPQILSSDQPIPEGSLAYIEQRAINEFYNVVLSRYRFAKENHNLTKAELARRINKGQDQVSRWLSSPSNWTIGTVARLLVGINNEEAQLSYDSFIGRTATNFRAEDSFYSENVPDLTDYRQVNTTHMNMATFEATQ